MLTLLALFAAAPSGTSTTPVGATVVIEKHHAVDRDAHRIVERNAEPLGHRMQLRMGADAGAAAGQLLGVALEHDCVPADAAQHIGGEQATDRTADDEGALFAHPVIASISAMTAGEGRFAAIFALDSLEHNDDIAPILAAFARALQPGGVFILSGPTESVLYKLGRAVAGFSGHYPVQTIYDIERQVAERFSRKARTLAPVGVPLFSISAWTVTA